MGFILSKFRSKKSITDKLEKLDKEISKLRQFRIQNQERQKRFIAKLLLYSILVYIVSALVFYFYYFPDRWKERLLYSIPLLLFPFIIWGVKKTLHWYFVKRIAKNDTALEDLKDKKKQILEDVMEKETYKKAKEILEKYDPERFKELETPKPTPMKSPGTELRHRQVGSATPAPGSQGGQIRPSFTQPVGVTPMRQPRPPVQIRPGMTPYGPRGSGQPMQGRILMGNPPRNGTPQGPVLPRPILPRERSTMDRLLEYLVGDGPQNRYALICRYCFAHNGMALKEEFEYISFKCCYCHMLNPARKKRPFAPRIEPQPVVTVGASNQEDDEGSGSEEESESEGEESDEGGNEEQNNHDNQVLEAAGQQPNTRGDAANIVNTAGGDIIHTVEDNNANAREENIVDAGENIANTGEHEEMEVENIESNTAGSQIQADNGEPGQNENQSAERD